VAWREERDAAAAAGETQMQEDRRAAHRQLRRQRKQDERNQVRHAEVEAAIHQLEEQLGELSQRIGKAGEDQDVEQVNALGAEYRAVEEQLQKLWAEWEELAAALEQ